MASTDAFADLPDDVIANIITCATSDIRGFAESSRRLLKAFRASCQSLHLSGEDGLVLTQVPKDRAFTSIHRLRYDVTCSRLTAPAATAALLLAVEKYPDLSHVCLASHEAPDEADPLLQTAWRISVGGLAPLVEQLLVLQRCRALVSLDLTFAGKMVAALVPLRGLTGLTQLRLAGVPRDSTSNYMFVRDLARLKVLPLRDLTLDYVQISDMFNVGLGAAPSPYPPTLTRLELSRSRRTGEHLPSLAACPELRTLDICYGGVQYVPSDRLDHCIDEHASCLQQLHTLHVRRYDPEVPVNFLAQNELIDDTERTGSFLPDGLTALTSLTRLSGKDWTYMLMAHSWAPLGAPPQLQVFTGALFFNWPPSVVTMPALQQLACRVGYQAPTPELLFPLLLRALPALQQLEAVLEDPPLPPMDRFVMEDVEAADFDQLPPEQQLSRYQRASQHLLEQLRHEPDAQPAAESYQSTYLAAIVAPAQMKLGIFTTLYRAISDFMCRFAKHILAQQPGTAHHLTRLVLRCCCSPQQAPRMISSCKALPPLAPALQQLELTFPLQPELVPGLLEVVACLTQLTSLALTAEAWPPAPEAAAGGAAVGPGGGAAAAAAGGGGGGGAAAAAAAAAAAGGAAMPEGAPSAAAAGGSAGIQQGPQLATHGSVSDEEMSAAEPAGAASQQATGGSSSLQAAAHAAAEAVTASLSGWHPLQQAGEPGPSLPSPGAGVTTDAQGGCAVSAEALAAAVLPLQQLQVLTIQGFAGVCPARLAALLLHYRPASQLRRLRHRGCGVVGDASTVRYAPVVRLLEAISF